MAFKPLKPAVEDQKNASSPNPGAEESDEYSSDDSESQEPVGDSEAKEEEPLPTTFSELGVIDPICEACSNLGFKAPTPIQAKAIPAALNHVDVIGLAQTGSGKTAAFSIPVLQALWEAPQELFACVLAPTRYALLLLVFSLSMFLETPKCSAAAHANMAFVRSIFAIPFTIPPHEQ